MTIYVDALVDYGVVEGENGPGWSRMCSTSIDELHAFATALGLHRRHFVDLPRHPHYLLAAGMRAKAVREGAQEVSAFEYIQLVCVLYGYDGVSEARHD